MIDTAFIAIFIVTALPLLFLLAFLKKEQRVLVYFLLWGLCAAIIVYYLRSLVDASGISTAYYAVDMGPLLEECMKALPLVLLFLAAGKKYDRHILPLAMASGIGFSILENYLYVSAMQAGSVDLLLMAATRALTTSLMHGCTTALIGYGLYLVRGLEKSALPSMLLGLYATAVTIHAIYNLLVMYSAWGKLIAVLLPIIMAFALLLLFYQDEIFEPDSKESHAQ